MHKWVVLRNNIKIYTKIYIKTAPTYFGVTATPSSGTALICAYKQHTYTNKDLIYAATPPPH